jgi:hypothetical protein
MCWHTASGNMKSGGRVATSVGSCQSSRNGIWKKNRVAKTFSLPWDNLRLQRGVFSNLRRREFAPTQRVGSNWAGRHCWLGANFSIGTNFSIRENFSVCANVSIGSKKQFKYFPQDSDRCGFFRYIRQTSSIT